MWFKLTNMQFCKIKNFPNGEINERGFSNPYASTIGNVIAHP